MRIDGASFNVGAMPSDFSEAYLSSLTLLLDGGARVPPVLDPLSPGSRFGAEPRETLELAPHVLQFQNPRSCLFFSPARIVRLAYCYGLLLWSLAGSDATKWLEYYHDRAGQFGDSPEHLSGAFGHRLLQRDGDQLSAVARRLGGDEFSRRTSCTIASPDDNFRSTREYPCGLATQYLIREGALRGFSFMRSQSAAMVLPYDVFLFCGLQCYLATATGLPPGPYTHVSASFHVYEDEISLARQICAVGARPVRVAPMVGGRALSRLQEHERILREAYLANDAHALAAILEEVASPQTFEEEAALILCAYAATRLQRQREAAEAVRRLGGNLQALAAANFLEG